MIRAELAKKDCAIVASDDMEYGTPFADGFNKGIEAGVKWADSHPDWHKWPEEKPSQTGCYFVALNHGLVVRLPYCSHTKSFDHHFVGIIIAWMELPQPPKFD